MKSFLLLCMLFVTSIANAQDSSRVHFKSATVDTTAHQLDSVLLLGVGGSGTRIFLDKFTDGMIQKFKDWSVTAVYQYLGPTVAAARKEYNLLKTGGYKTIFLLLPKDSAFFDVKSKTSLAAPLGYALGSYLLSGPRLQGYSFPGISANHTLEFHGGFNLQIINNGSPQKLVWTAVLDINSALDKKSMYKYAVEQIFTDFVQRRYLSYK